MTASVIDYNGITIPTFIINLKEREDRLKHIIEQFKDRPEFDLTLMDACKHKIGAIGLWESITKIVQLAIINEDDVIIICEDDHLFTEFYSKEYLISNIIEANEQGAAILSGGIGGFGHAVPLTPNRFWVDSFLSTQFIVLYKRIFEDIVNHKFKKHHVADVVLSELTSHKMILHPYVSEQRDFGYSDITSIHNEIYGIVTIMFERTNSRLEKIKNAYLRYSKDHVLNGK